MRTIMNTSLLDRMRIQAYSVDTASILFAKCEFPVPRAVEGVARSSTLLPIRATMFAKLSLDPLTLAGQ